MPLPPRRPRTWVASLFLTIHAAACGPDEEPDVGAEPQILATKLVTTGVLDDHHMYFPSGSGAAELVRVPLTGGPTETVLAEACPPSTTVSKLSVVNETLRWGCTGKGPVTLWRHHPTTGAVQLGEVRGALAASAVLGERWFVSVTPGTGAAATTTAVLEVGVPEPIATLDGTLSGLVADERGLFVWSADGGGARVQQIGLDGSPPREIARTAGSIEWLRVEGSSWLRVERALDRYRVVRRSFDADVDDERASFEKAPVFDVTSSGVYFSHHGDEIWHVGLDRSAPRVVFARPRATDGFTIGWMATRGDSLVWSAGKTRCASPNDGSLCCCKRWTSSGRLMRLSP